MIFSQPRLFPACLLLLLFLTMGLPAAAYADSGVKNPVRVGVVQNKPLSFKDQEGRFRGIYPDLLREIAKAEGWTLKFRPDSWAGCLRLLTKGDIDLMISIVNSKERGKVYDFSRETVITVWGEVFVKKSSEINSILDLNGKTVVLAGKDISGKNFREACSKFKVSPKFLIADTYHDLSQKIVSGQADAGVMNNLNGVWFQRHYDLYPTPIMFNPVNSVFAVRKGSNKALLQAIDAKLSLWKLDKKSVYYQILNRWHANVEPQSEIRLELILSALGIGAGVCLFLLMWLALLRRQVKARTAELAESEQRFRQAFESANVGMTLVDLQKKFMEVNQAFADMLGYTREELKGKSVFDLTYPEDKDLGSNFFDSGRDVKQAGVRIEKRYVHKLGHVVWVHLASTLVRDSRRTPLHLVNHVQDITSNKRAEQEKALLEAQLRQAQKMEALGTLSGGIAHDFNNILAAIIGYTELALEDALLDKTAPEDLRCILKAAGRARDLVTHILTFSRRAEVKLMPLEINRQIKDTVRILKSTLPRMINISSELAGGLGPVIGNPTQLEQVLLNLASNASDAMPDGGRLTFATKNVRLDEDYCRAHLGTAPGEYVCLTVSDTGDGMNPESLSQIFDPFFTTKEVGKGTGLGLSSVFGIVKGLGGHIACQSKPDAGTTFEIFLPVHPHDSERPGADTQPDPGQAPGGSETILLVDDEPALREIGEKKLARAGYQVLPASSGEQALSMLSLHWPRIDLVILDVSMPGMGGLKCLKKILKRRPQAKVLMASGYSKDAASEQILKSGAAGFVAKPLTGSEFLIKIRQVLDA